MPDETQIQFEALLKQGERTLGAIEGLGTEIRALAQSIVKGFAQTQQPPTGRTTNGQTWILLLAVMGTVGGLMFGLMAPLTDGMKAISQDVTDHKNLPGHSKSAASIKAFSESLKEVETKFGAMKEKIADAHDVQDHDRAKIEAQVEELQRWRLGWVDRVARIDATQSEKIATLEQRTRGP